MTRRLEEIFDLPSDKDTDNDVTNDTILDEETVKSVELARSTLAEMDREYDKIDSALPEVTGLDEDDQSLDEYADKAMEAYTDLTDLGMNVEPRHASEILTVASSMFGHALRAKEIKQMKKLKMIDLQLRKRKLDLDTKRIMGTTDQDEPAQTAQGFVLSRNELLEKIIGDRNKTNKNE